MSDRDALLAAIRANPDEDTPRLVFADWLDEHEPDAKPRAGKVKLPSPSSWASLIRAECEFERLKNDGSVAAAVFDYFVNEDEKTLDGVRWERVLPEMCRRVELYRLIPTLRQASAKARSVNGQKASPGGTWIDTTFRGFPAEINVWDSNKWYGRLTDLIAFCPPVRIDFNTNRATLDPEVLLAAGFARWCRGLNIFANTHDANLIAAMSRSPDTAGVRELRFNQTDDNQIPRVLAAIADSPHWSGLRTLAFHSSFQAPPELPVRLFRSRHLRGLKRLSFHSYAETPNLVEAFGELTELTELSLAHCNLHDADAIQLANMPGLANLRFLYLPHNHITGHGASALLASPHLKKLAVLDFEGNPIRGLNRKTLANAPTGGLRALNLQSGRMTATDLATITASPRTSELLYFSACHNSFRESAIVRLVKGFGNHAPAVLYLMGTQITTLGAETLANWPAAAKIDMLHLRHNRLSVPGAEAIAGCPHLQQLNHLCAGVNHSSARTLLKKQFGDRVEV